MWRLSLVFGGWSQESTPLDHCELLNYSTLCWTHCSTRSNSSPAPRGNPTLVYETTRNIALLYGGWNGEKRFSDLWFLDMNSWEWKKQNDNVDSWPRGRTDHSAVLWNDGDGPDLMVIFGGSLHGEGPTAELWIWNLENNYWKEIHAYGPAARTSHTAAVIGD